MSDDRQLAYRDPPPRVERPSATADWSHLPKYGDGAELRVTRVDGGSLTNSWGGQSIEIRRELVSVLASMVGAASRWTDTGGPP